jgi:hypothetical protein
MVRNYLVMELVEHRRAADPHYKSLLLRRAQDHSEDGDLSMLPLYLQDAVCSLEGKGASVDLTNLERAELLELWRLLHPPLDVLFARYEEDVRTGRTNDPIWTWHPLDGGPPLSDAEQQMRLAPCLQGAEFVRGFRNSTYLRSFRVDAKFARTNCCFKAFHHKHGLCYGVVDSLILHRAFRHASSPVSVFVKVGAWCRILSPDPNNGLTRCEQILDDPDPAHHPFASLFCPAGDILPFPVTFVAQSETEATRIYYVFEFWR